SDLPRPHGLDASITIAVVDPTENFEPIRIVETTDPFAVDVEWCICGPIVPGLGGCWNISLFGGIHLTGLGFGCGTGGRRSLPEVGGRVPGLVPERRRLPGLPGVAALAGGLHVPRLRPHRPLAAGRWPAPVRRMRRAHLGDGRDDL